MAWYNESVFYHIYPLGMTGAPKINDYKLSERRLLKLFPFVEKLKNTGFSAIYIGPLFQSVGHGYETTDYKCLDSRLGTNEDLKSFVSHCHKNGIRVIFDGVFNHTGRDFFAFKDILEKREGSRYKNWYNINFWGNNSYNDGFSYENWGGYDLLVKLNQKNPEVTDYITDVIRFWVSEFDVDGIRLDAADVLDFDFMKKLRTTANEVKEDFWLMGEVIHGDYNRWANAETLHSVTNYHLHKALYSGHNDRNYFEIAHTVKRLQDMDRSLILYNFADNHDVERIYTKLHNKSHFVPVHILLFTLPGIPSIYYGSELGIEGRKEKHSDDSLRPCIPIEAYEEKEKNNPFIELISALCKIRSSEKALFCGEYKELLLTNRQYAFSRSAYGKSVIVAVNNDDNEASLSVSAYGCGSYTGALGGEKYTAADGRLNFTLKGNSGEIFIPDGESLFEYTPVKIEIENKTEKITQKEEKNGIKSEIKEEKSATEEKLPPAPKDAVISDKSYEEMTVEELQAVILGLLAKNGPVTDRMRKDVEENVYHNSLVTWAKSFR